MEIDYCPKCGENIGPTHTDIHLCLTPNELEKLRAENVQFKRRIKELESENTILKNLCEQRK